MTWNSTEFVPEKLLGSKLARTGFAGADCPGFDADIANSFIEGILGAGERTKYQLHLAACADCRTSVVKLAELAEVSIYEPLAEEAEAVPATAGGADIPARPRIGWRAWLGRPGWVLAATAIAIVGIVTPILITRNAGSSDQNTATSRNQPGAPVAEAVNENPAPSSANGQLAVGNAPVSALTDAASKARGQSESEAADGASAGAIAGKPANPTGNPAAESDSKSTQDQPATASQPKQEAAKDAERQPGGPSREAGNGRASDDRSGSNSLAKSTAPGASSPVPPKPESKRLDSLDKAEALKLPSDTAADSSVVKKAGEPSVVPPRTEKEKTATIRPDDAGPKTQSGSDDPVARRGLARGSSTSATEGERKSEETSGSRARAPKSTNTDKGERKVMGRKFRLQQDGFWTDEGYRQDLKLPVVSVERDSDIYAQLLARLPSLKLYFAGFTPAESAIVIYKSTIYKLVPPKKAH